MFSKRKAKAAELKNRMDSMVGKDMLFKGKCIGFTRTGDAKVMTDEGDIISIKVVRRGGAQL